MEAGVFNIRVYGILVNDHQEVLVSDELAYGMSFTKFPGGGLEYGEGLSEGLVREFREECDAAITVLRHIYTTDGFIKSAFNDSQVIAVYYLVRQETPLKGRFSEKKFDFDLAKATDQVFRWVPIGTFDVADLTFETDRAAWRAFLS